MSQGGGQWRVGGALGGHYTDGSPQPLTNLDLVPVHVIIVMINTISLGTDFMIIGALGRCTAIIVSLGEN